MATLGQEGVLTEKGRRLVETHERARVLFQAALDRGGIDPVQAGSWVRFLRRISMRTSARNQLPGTVAGVREGSVNAEVDIALVGGANLVAQVTMPSVSQLGLKAGVPVVALVKSSWVVLACGEAEPRVSSRNRLRATVTAVVAGTVNSEVGLRLAGGELMVATVTNESIGELGLVEGCTAWALFKASSVILAV